MLLTETRKYDITTCVLDPSAEAPCRIGANVFTQGSLTDYNTVYNFGKAVDVLTIEIENVNVEALQQLQNEGVKSITPHPLLSKQYKIKLRKSNSTLLIIFLQLLLRSFVMLKTSKKPL